MSFLHESLLWIGVPLVGLPVLIHLINMFRHRRVQWAAMEFLLASQRRHRKWIILRQLLLLLLRMAAVAAIALMVAQPLAPAQWGSLFGGSKTHHIVLLDDSYSMSDRWATTSAFDEAKRMVSRIAAEAARQETPQNFTLLRFSRSRHGTIGTQPDLLTENVQPSFVERLDSTLARLHPSESAAGPLEALEAIDGLPVKPDDENRVIYIVSDFRANQWKDPTALHKTLERLELGGAQLQFDNCVDAARPNLGVVDLRPAAGVRAAGVPLLMELAVQNFGATPVRHVSVSLDEDGLSRPAVEFEEILPGKIATRRFHVLFSTAGQHVLTARLESDAVAADNARYAALDVSLVTPVLVIDSDPKDQDAFLISTALAPGGKAASGLKPVVAGPRAIVKGTLDKNAAVLLANVERLDPSEIEALEDYVRRGGGVAFFLGEKCRSDFYNQQLYRGGEGLFPLPIGSATELLVDRLDKAPDLEVGDHPIFSVFAGERNSFIGSVMIERYFTAAKGWSPPSDSTVQVIARLRNHAPLVVERKFGAGRVVAFLTKASPAQTVVGTWNNWGRNNPSFVVALLELEAYLAATRQDEVSRLVGAPLEVAFDPGAYQPQVRFTLPPRSPTSAAADTLTVDATPRGAQLVAAAPDTDSSGVYLATLVSPDAQEEVRRWAYNVGPEEGNLERLDNSQLASRLPGLRIKYNNVRDLSHDLEQLAGYNLGENLAYLLIAILIVEQLLAYATSYHPATRDGGRA
jgi:uncharacterized membrane protein